MTSESSKYERFDKSRTYRFLVWEPGAPDPILISSWWNPAFHGGMWQARKETAEGHAAATYTPFGAVRMVCDSAGIVIDEIATQAVIEREIEATKADLDAAVKHRERVRADCAQMEDERNKALCDLMNANAALGELRGQHERTTALLEEKSARCAGLFRAVETANRHASTAEDARDEMRRRYDVVADQCASAEVQRDAAIAERDSATARMVEAIKSRDREVEVRRAAQDEVVAMERERDAYLAEIDAARKAFTRDEYHRGLDLATAIGALCAKLESESAALKESNRQFAEFKKLRPVESEIRSALDESESLRGEVSLLREQRDRLLLERGMAVNERNESERKLAEVTKQRNDIANSRDLAVGDRALAIRALGEAQFERNEAIKQRDEQHALYVKATDECEFVRHGLKNLHADLRAEKEKLLTASQLGSEVNASLRRETEKLCAAIKERDAAVNERHDAITCREHAISERGTAIKERDAAIKERDAANKERYEATTELDNVTRELESLHTELFRARDLTKHVQGELNRERADRSNTENSLRYQLDAMTRLRDEAGEALNVAVQGRDRARHNHDRLDLLILKTLNAESTEERSNTLRELAVSAGYAATADGLGAIYTERDVLRMECEKLKVRSAVTDGSLANAKEVIAAQTKTIEEQSAKILHLTDERDVYRVKFIDVHDQLNRANSDLAVSREVGHEAAKRCDVAEARMRLAEQHATLAEAQRDTALLERDAATADHAAAHRAIRSFGEGRDAAVAERDAALLERDYAKSELARAVEDRATAVEELAKQHATEKQLRAALEQRTASPAVRYVESHAIVCEELASRLDAIGRHSQASAVRSCVEIHNARHILLGMVILEVPSRFHDIVANVYSRETWNASRGLMMADPDAPTGDPWEYVEHLARRQGVKIANPSR